MNLTLAGFRDEMTEKKYKCTQLNITLTVDEAKRRRYLPCHGCVVKERCKLKKQVDNG